MELARYIVIRELLRLVPVENEKGNPDWDR